MSSQKTERPGALVASATEANNKAGELCLNDTPKSSKSAMSKYAHPDHKGAAKMLGFALVRRGFDGWRDFSDYTALALSTEERVALAWAALRALEARESEAVIETVCACASMPLPTFLSAVDDARFWADMAAPAEHEAYCLAAFRAMPPGRQSAFVDYVTRRAAA